jgi:2-phosphosulfolactate phosphatase
MNIRILQLLDGAKQARGLTVIIDVFRAFTVAPWLIQKGAARIIPVAEVETAFNLKQRFPDAILVGERNEQKIPGFDYGNSPSHLMDAQLLGKTVIHTTSSGTQGIANAQDANEIITGSFVNADAIVRYIQAKNPDEVSLVCMGYACTYPTEEDSYCAEYIARKLKGEAIPFDEWTTIIKQTSGARFFDPSKEAWSPASDFHYCMKINVFDFILKAEQQPEGYIQLIPYPI